MNNYLRAKQVRETKHHFSYLELLLFFAIGPAFFISIYFPSYEKNYLIPLLTSSFVGLLYYYKYLYKNNTLLKKSKTWKPIKAKVVHSKIMTHIAFMDKRGGFLPSIKYIYELEGKRYTSNQFTLFPTIILKHKEEEAKKLMYEIAESKEITVYVNPHNHSEAFIYNGNPTKIFNAYILGFTAVICFPLFGPIFYFYYEDFLKYKIYDLILYFS